MKKVLTLLLLMTQVMISCAQESQQQTATLQPGSTVEDFKLKNIDGKMVSMADYSSAKGFIVVFTCNTCPYAKAYEQRIMDLDKQYAAKGYPVIAINPNDPGASPGDSFELMKQRAAEKKYTFPYLIDPDHVITKRFGASKTPHVFLLTKSGNDLKTAYIGAIDNDTEDTNPKKDKFLETAIESVMQGKALSVTTTKAVGCTIKWKKS